MSKLLKRALKIAILPASLMVVGKFVSVFILIALNQIQFSIVSSSNSIFSIQLFLETQEEVLKINSYSNLITLLLVAVPTLYMIVKKTVLQSAQENPRTVVKLTKLNILKWITGSKTALLQITIWCMFLWVITAICIASSINSGTHMYIAIAASILSILATWGLIKTFDSETDKIYPRNNQAYF